MHSLLLFDVNERKMSTEALLQVFQSVAGFQRIRFDTPIGTPIGADFVDGDDFTTVDLDSARETISIRGTSGAALKAAWLIQSNLDVPLRMVDTDYSFDLVLQDFHSCAELSNAIDESRAR